MTKSIRSRRGYQSDKKVDSSQLLPVLNYFVEGEVDSSLEVGINRPRRHTIDTNVNYPFPRTDGLKVQPKTVKKFERGIAVFVLFFCSYYINLLASVVAGYRTPNVKGLPDISHEFVDTYIDDVLKEYLSVYHVRHLPDFFLTISLIFAVSFWLADNRKFVIIVRFFNVTSLILIFRAYCITITNLPDMSPHCQRQFEVYTCWGILKCPDPSGAYKNRAIFPDAIYRANELLVSPYLDTCGDLMFSGHTVGIWLVQMLYMEYCDLSKINIFISCLTIIGTASIIITKFHYGLDVSIAIFVVYCTWTLYHRWSKNKALQKTSIFGKPFRWMEAAMDKHTETKLYYA